MCFIAEIHWRVPNQDDNAYDYINKIIHGNSILQAKDRVTGEIISKKAFNRLKDEPSVIKASKIIRAMENFISLNNNYEMGKWLTFLIIHLN